MGVVRMRNKRLWTFFMNAFTIGNKKSIYSPLSILEEDFFRFFQRFYNDDNFLGNKGKLLEGKTSIRRSLFYIGWQLILRHMDWNFSFATLLCATIPFRLEKNTQAFREISTNDFSKRFRCDIFIFVPFSSITHCTSQFFFFFFFFLFFFFFFSFCFLR